VSFGRPDLLHTLWAVAFLAAALVLAFRAAGHARALLAGKELLPKLAPGWTSRRPKVKAVIQVAAFALLAFAIAGPRVGSREVTVKRKGIDIVIAIDVSNSMLARDVSPSRLSKAKREVAGFLERVDGDRVGLVAFAGDAYLQCPLTVDYGAARMFLDVLDTDSVTRQGTNLGAAIRTALTAFGAEEKTSKAIILVTDGEDLAGEGLAAAEEAAKRGVRIDTIGIGSERGEPIPVVSEDGSPGGYKRDPSGEIVMTRLDPESLERIALAANGRFHRATTGELELDRLHAELSTLEEQELGARTFTQYEERFQIPLALAALFFLADFLTPEGRRPKRGWKGRFA
jgi:Ca-activated chloride channel family protein